MTTDIPKNYLPQEIEKKWYQFWLDRDYFRAKDKSNNPPFSIVIPPPNITGSLHTGHALDNTLQDTLIRWKRMQGYNTLWMPGTDHAGIVTELIMERTLVEEGTSRQEIGREKFIDRMWQWKDESRGKIISQLQEIGSSCDWERERFTLDAGLSKAVRTAFVKLYERGLIYRGDYMVNWCPNCQTAVSDLEVVPIEIEGNFYHIKYSVTNSDEFLVIATTRPETMLGDTAVAVHPEDERYKHLVGKTAILPILGRELPIIADQYVDMDTGTGALKVTPAHDLNDYEIGKRHDLETINIFDDNGTLNENAGKEYASLDRFDCRSKLIKDLQSQQLLLKVVDHLHSVGHHDRCDQIIEPYISPQWYVDVKPLAERAIEASKTGQITFIPDRETKRFHQWMEDILPWSISRQRWWGHRIPIWYCGDCQALTCTVDTPDQCSDCNSKNLKQDEDVLDTWFSSGLWPFSTMGWPENTELLKTFYPTSVLVTGWDILFFWVSRMIMLGLECMGHVPFNQVYLHGLVADEHGKKMSKSRGNTIDPVETIEKYGADAFRFAIVYSTIPLPYMPLPEYQIEAGRRFANKIWNASRFLLMNLEDYDPNSSVEINPQLVDKWICSRFDTAVQSINEAFGQFRFSDAAHIIYEFMWHEFCDWYVEMIKQRLYYSDDPVAKYTAQTVAIEILDGTLRLLHPIMPFLTEEIWQQLPVTGDSITISSYPEPNQDSKDAEAEMKMRVIMDVIDEIRSIRGEMNIPPSTEIEILIQAPNVDTRQILETHLEENMRSFTKFMKVSIAEYQEKPKSASTAIIEDLIAYVPLSGVLDIDEEKKRLQKKLDKTRSELENVEKTLANKNFVERAPKQVIDQKYERKTKLESEQEKILVNLHMFD